MNTGIKEQVLAEIIALAEKNSIEKLVLFGSRARGDYRRTSDIDLAASGGNVAEFVMDLNEETATLLKFDVVDLGRSVQPALIESIQREGKILYEKI